MVKVGITRMRQGGKLFAGSILQVRQYGWRIGSQEVLPNSGRKSEPFLGQKHVDQALLHAERSQTPVLIRSFAQTCSGRNAGVAGK
jgi:hypothetical protein